MEPSQTTLRKIEKAPQTLRDIVQERMREAIIDGHFAPGERLVERPLCDQLGVSRTVIRETIRYLEAEGLVEIIPNRGPVVARLTWDQARQIYDVRRQLEAAAAAASAEVQRPEFAADLSRALAEVEASMSDTEWGHLLRATTGFYQLIFLEGRPYDCLGYRAAAERSDQPVARPYHRGKGPRNLRHEPYDRHSRCHSQPQP
ncbi:GntR family transcriptional regulator [Phaeobacter sp. A36a-5a]|uniref:GntR family transcriptional regulator n=1 Tax=Phaeobacter bryozoorum TaxID=1086632 RepID=UPI0035A5CF8E